MICFGLGQMPIGAKGDRVSQPKTVAPHIATLKVQPVLFHINISQRDQAPGLSALPQGARIPQTDTDTISR